MSCCAASAAVGEMTPRTTDHVAAFGEMLSSNMVAAAFAARGLTSCAGRFAAVHRHRQHPYPGRASVRGDQSALAEKVSATAAPKAIVPVMGGFIGATRTGITTTIGRGGSDFSAAIIGAGLGAERIEIWTDVDGMMTTDPEHLSRCAADQGHQLRRGRRTGVFRR